MGRVAARERSEAGVVPGLSRSGHERHGSLAKVRLVCMPLDGGRVSQGEKDGLPNRGFAVSDGSGLAADDRVIVGGGGDVAESTASGATARRQRTQGERGRRADLRRSNAWPSLQEAARGT